MEEENHLSITKDEGRGGGEREKYSREPQDLTSGRMLRQWQEPDIAQGGTGAFSVQLYSKEAKCMTRSKH